MEGRVWRDMYITSEIDAIAVYQDESENDEEFGQVWKGHYVSSDLRAVACYKGGQIWFGEYSSNDLRVDACYGDSYIWLKSFPESVYRAKLRYRDGYIWEGPDFRSPDDAIARYEGSDDGAAAAAAWLFQHLKED